MRSPIAFVILSALAMAAPAQPPVDRLARLSFLSPTDKTLWMVPDRVAVGTLLHTDPSGWNARSGTYFRVDSRYLEGKFATYEAGPVSETLAIDDRIDIAALLPFLQMIGGAFRSTSHASVTATDEKIMQTSAADTVRNTLPKYDRHIAGPGNAQRNDIFGRINRALDRTGNRSDAAEYWLVTKVYRAASTDWSRGVAIGVGCPVAPTVPDMPASAPSPSGAAVSPAPAATAAGEPAKASPTAAVALTRDGGGKIGGSLNAGLGQASVAAGTGGKPSAGGDCRLGRFVVGGGREAILTATGAVLFGQIQPIFHRSRGRLYVPEPGGSDPILAPKVVSRS